MDKGGTSSQGINNIMWASIGKRTWHKADGHKDSPSGWRVPGPLHLSGSLRFFPSLHTIHTIRRGSQRRSALGRPHSPHAPWCFHFLVLSPSPSSVKRGSQEVMWELNTRLGYNTRACWGLVACSFGNTAALEKSWSPISVETKIKINQRQPEEKRDKIMHLCMGYGYRHRWW